MEPTSQIWLDYPVTPTARWGYGKPAHQRLHDILNTQREQYAEHLHNIVTHEAELKTIPLWGRYVSRPAWNNGWFEGLDLAALHMFVATHRPARYIEIGSGNSTKITRHAARKSDLSLHITSIDPAPRAEIDVLCDEVIRQSVETIDQTLFDDLGPGDILFVDNSHRVFTNSDAVVILLEVLPRLQPGVLIHIHDVFLPYDYPPEWSARFYSEQYLLAAWLLAEGPHVRVELANMFVSRDEELAAILNPLWTGPLSDVQRHGGSFWLRKL